MKDSDPDHWLIPYTRIKADMGASRFKGSPDASDAFATRKDASMEAPATFRIPQAVFSKYPFRRVTKSQLRIVV